MMTAFASIFLTAALGGQDPAPAGAPAAADEVRRFSLVYTINNFGVIEPQGCPYKVLHDGGLARRLTCVRQLQAAEAPLLLLDGGATFFPDIDKAPDADREKLLLKAELIAEAYNRAGYKAMAVGTTDLLLGIGELNHIAGRSKFPLLCANLETPAGKPFPASTVVEVGGLKVGIFGLVVDTMGKVYLERVVPGGKLLPAIETARTTVAGLRGKVDLVIALSHLRMDINKEIAAKVEGIDLIIDPSIEYGNHHPRIKDGDWEEVVGKTAILRADGNGSSLGVAEIEVRKVGAGMGSRARLLEIEAAEKEGKADADDKKELAELRTRNLFFLRRLPLAPHYADDAEGAALLQAFKEGGDVAKVPARPAPAARDDYVTAEVCKECHEKQYKNWTTTRHFRAFEGIIAAGQDRRVECISCHATGYGPGFVDPAEAKTFAGVQCEACHGTSVDHLKDPKAHRLTAIAESTCLPCHNEDVVPGKDFSYGLALRRIQCPKGD
jgi:hypothetical protein